MNEFVSWRSSGYVIKKQERWGIHWPGNCLMKRHSYVYTGRFVQRFSKMNNQVDRGQRQMILLILWSVTRSIGVPTICRWCQPVPFSKIEAFKVDTKKVDTRLRLRSEAKVATVVSLSFHERWALSMMILWCQPVPTSMTGVPTK